MNNLLFVFPLLGECNISFNDDLIADFTKRQLMNYFYNSDNTQKINTSRHIILEFADHDILTVFSQYATSGIVAGSNYIWNGNKLITPNYIYEITSTCLRIQYKNTSNISLLKTYFKKLLAWNEEKQYSYLSMLFYSMVLYPILSVYAAKYGLYAIHGSLLYKEGKGIILSGLDGVGKSTLSKILSDNNDYKLLADNIVLFDSVKALNFNLTMRLDEKEPCNWPVLYSNKNLKEVLPPTKDHDLCNVNTIILLTMKTNNNEISYKTRTLSLSDWVLFLEGAPEIRGANDVLSYWLMMHSLHNEKTCINSTVLFWANIPKGKLIESKEKIINEFKIFYQ